MREDMRDIDIPFDLLPIFVLSNDWMRFVIWLVIYAVFLIVLQLLSAKILSKKNDNIS